MAKIRKIALIHECPKFYGGAEDYTIEMADYFKDIGISVDLYYSPEFHPERNFTKNFSNTFPLLSPFEQLKGKYDIIYVQNYKDHLSKLNKKYLRTPVFKFVHDHFHFCLRRSKIKAYDSSTCEKTVGLHCYSCPGFAYKEGGQLKINSLKSIKNEHLALSKMDGLIVGSKYLDKHIRRHKIPAKKIFINPLYSDFPTKEDTSTRKRENSILFAGSLIKGKGVDILLRAFSQSNKKLRLYIAGSGPKENEYKKLCTDLGIQKNVIFLGRINKNELKSYFQKVKAHVVPSTFPETFSKVGIDGAILGSIPICSDVGAVSSWLKNKKNGLTFKSGDITSLSEILIGLEQNKFEHLKPVINPKFSKKNHFKRLVQVFRQTINKFEDYPNFSYDENNQFVELMNGVNKFVTDSTLQVIPKHNIKCIILIGGYGRGEGGVIQKGNKLIPHNNLDFNIITKGFFHKEKDAQRKKILNLINQKLPHNDITIDISINEKFKIKYAESKLIYYDMKFGHRLAYGSDTWLKNLTRINPKNIPIFDMRELILNRGMLLLLNEQILKKSLLTQADKKIIIRHMVKAIIGYGDGLLFAHGRYHWSYKRKSQLMLQIESLYPDYAKLYMEAIKFRFNPNYEKFKNRDLKTFNKYIIRKSEKAHLNFEKVMQKKASIDWGDFLRSMLTNPFFNDKVSFLNIAKVIKNLVSTKNKFLVKNSKSFFCFHLFHRLVGSRKQLVGLFPFHLYSKSFPNSIKNFEDNNLNLDAYINLWGGAADINFAHSRPAQILNSQNKKKAS